MKYFHHVVSLLTISMLLALVMSVQASGPSTDELALRAAAADWAKAAADKDLEKTVSFYAENAHMYAFNAPRTETKEDIRRVWTKFLTSPATVLQTKTMDVVVARSGDLAYETGTFELKQTATNEKTETTPGKYVVVWRKQANQQWKAVADIFNTDK